ncbi:MAG: hypothetical protein ACRDJS_06895 [Actinomycetota bacterium]
MRKAIVVLVAGLLLLVAFAAPAFALRDPFDPVVDLTPETAGGSGGGGAEEEATRADVGGSGGTEGGTITNSETLANTGSDVEPWVVVAYGLIAVGAAAVVLSKTFSPLRTKR